MLLFIFKILLYFQSLKMYLFLLYVHICFARMYVWWAPYA